MKYIEINIPTSGAGTEIIASELMSIGILNVMIDDPMIDIEMMDNKGESEYVDRNEFDLTREPSVTVYLDYDEAGMLKAEEIRHYVDGFRREVESGLYGEDFDAGRLDVSVEVRDDSEWKDNWKAYFKPARISEKVVVRPSWEEYEAADGEELVVAINPGMAFGTGTHETTSLSVRALEKYLKAGDRVLDVGCGTGILSIIACKLGASHVLAIDIDEAAIDASNENIELNGLAEAGDECSESAEVTAEARDESAEAECDLAEGCCISNETGQIDVRLGDLTEGVDYVADVVVANLLTPLILKLTGDVSGHLAEGGLYISSGILVEHEERVYEVLKDNGFKVIETMEDGDWCSITASKISSNM